MLTGACHCGKVTWTFDGMPEGATACNCTVCRRYGVLWIYDWENQKIRMTGETAFYTRVDMETPEIEFHFCPTCACVIAWRGVKPGKRGAKRMAVNVRLSEPETVAHLPIDHFEGLVTFEDLPRDGRTVEHLWF